MICLCIDSYKFCCFKCVECVIAEEKYTGHLHTRLEHLKEHADEQKSSVILWKKKRVDRMLVDHLLRAGYYETASKLAVEAHIEVKSQQ